MEIAKSLEFFCNRLFDRFGQKHGDVLAAIRSLRNGLVYGSRARAPHALVMVMLFSNGSLLRKARTIVSLTARHAMNLGCFAFSYKLLLAILRQYSGRYCEWHPFAIAFFVAYFIFGKENVINTQINLYLLSRVLYALVRLANEKLRLKINASKAFPWYAAIVWGIGLWLWENHENTLQKSLQSSMAYLYRTGDSWNGIRDLVF